MVRVVSSYMVTLHRKDRKQEWLFLNSAAFCQIGSIAQFDKTSHAWQFKELVIVFNTGGTESSLAYLGEELTCNPRAWVQSPPMFCLMLHIFH